jgi:hypothetical protein
MSPRKVLPTGRHYLSITLSLYHSITLSLYICIPLSIDRSIDLSIYLDLCMYVSIYLSIYRSIYLSIYRSIYYLSIYLSIYLLYYHDRDRRDRVMIEFDDRCKSIDCSIDRSKYRSIGRDIILYLRSET